MMDNPGCFALMLGDESQADGMFSAISSEEVVIRSSRWRPRAAVFWRCLAVEKLSQVELRTGPWRTEPRAERQTCIGEVDFDIDAQPGDDPQNGQ
jgi:hypothetical protein